MARDWRNYLTAPTLPVFLISVVMALAAVLVVYGKVALFGSAHAFLVLLIAYIVLAAACLFRGV